MLDDREGELGQDEDFFASLLPDGGASPDEPASPEPREGAEGETPQDEPSPEGEPARDERGRFAPRGQVEGRGQPEREVPPGEMIPPWRLREEAERRREEADRRQQAEHEAALLRQQVAELAAQIPQPVEDSPDVLIEPERFAATIEHRIQNQFERRFVNGSMGRAHRQYKDEFAQAYRSLAQQDDYTRERILAADDPGEAMMDWHRAHSALSQFGADPVAYRGRVANELLADPEFRKHAIETWRSQAAGKGNQRPVDAAGLPSLNRATRAARDTIDLEEDDVEFFQKSLRLQR